jgi:hypothetical protein
MSLATAHHREIIERPILDHSERELRVLPQAVRTDRKRRRRTRTVELRLEVFPLVGREILVSGHEPPLAIVRARCIKTRRIRPHGPRAIAAQRLVVDAGTAVDHTAPAI